MPWVITGSGPLRAQSAIALAPVLVLVALTFTRFRRGARRAERNGEELEKAA